jgi:hypothetical protein
VSLRRRDRLTFLIEEFAGVRKAKVSIADPDIEKLLAEGFGVTMRYESAEAIVADLYSDQQTTAVDAVPLRYVNGHWQRELP